MILKMDNGIEVEGDPEEVTDFLLLWSQKSAMDKFCKLADKILEAED